MNKKKLTPTQKIKLVEYCAIYCAEMFVVFSDKKNQGENFTWRRFPAIVSGLCKVNTFQMFPPEFPYLDEAEEYVEIFSTAICEAMSARVKENVERD